MENLETLHKMSGWHEEAILKSTLCGCFSCLNIFRSDQINEWAEEDPNCPNGPGKTAICPKCGIDSVLPDSTVPQLSLDLLKKMKIRWFG